MPHVLKIWDKFRSKALIRKTTTSGYHDHKKVRKVKSSKYFWTGLPLSEICNSTK